MAICGRHLVIKSGIALSVAGFICGGVNSADANASWMIETVDPSVGPNAFNSYVNFSPDGELHVAYFDSEDSAPVLKIAERASVGWNRRIIDRVEGNNPVLKYGQDGVGHLIYSGEQGQLRYGNTESGDWKFDDLDTGNRPTGTATLEVDETNRPHVAFSVNAVPFELNYGTILDNGWSFETLSQERTVGDLFFDPFGEAYIVSSGSPSELLFQLDGRWTSLEGIQPVLAPNSIAGRATETAIEFIAHRVSDDLLIHWWLNARGTHTTVIDSTGPSSMLRAGAVWTDDDRIGVAYLQRQTENDSEIRFAHLQDGEWNIETIADRVPSDSGASIAWHEDNGFAVTYWAEPGRLVVATRPIPEPSSVITSICGIAILLLLHRRTGRAIMVRRR